MIDNTLDGTCSKTIQWAVDRNLIKGSDSTKQFLKLVSEIGELGDALNKRHAEGIIDGIGDAVVVLTIMAAQEGLTLQQCFAHSYNEIKDRKGVMFNGVFIKSTDALYDDAVATLARGNAQQRKFFGQVTE